MKKTIFTLIITMFVAAITFVSCKPSTKEEIEAKENVLEAEAEVQEAKEDLSEARKQANADEWQEFKDDMNDAINKNDARIAELKLEMKRTGKSVDAKYEKSIDDLEQKNKHLKIKMESYKNDVNSDWQSFKREFNHDMDELGSALKDLTVNNKK
ncbi:MAG: hypothetical protein V4572_12965 [Bacteroidota bacterium]